MQVQSGGNVDGRKFSIGRRVGCAMFAFVGAIAGLAMLSYLTTSAHWDHGFAHACYRFRVVDEERRPVEGALFEIQGPTRDVRSSFVDYGRGRWPIYEAGQQELRTDPSGTLIVHQPERGLQYGGLSYDLFWVISIGRDAPEFTCVFSKRGYREKRIAFSTLDELTRRTVPTEIRRGPGGIEYPVVDVDVVLGPG